MRLLFQALAIAGGAATALTVLVIAFRRVARHHSTACPAWLTVLLENPYFEVVAGSSTLLERAHIDQGQVVLDVGCGPGRVAVPAARLVGPAGRVIALDLQEAMLRKLRCKLTHESLSNVVPVRGGAGEGHLPTNVADRALLVTVLGEIVDRDAALREIYDSLKPTGILSVTEALPDPHYQTQSTVRRLAERVGFRCIEGFGSWWAFTLNFAKREVERTHETPGRRTPAS